MRIQVHTTPTKLKSRGQKILAQGPCLCSLYRSNFIYLARKQIPTNKNDDVEFPTFDDLGMYDCWKIISPLLSRSAAFKNNNIIID